MSNFVTLHQFAGTITEATIVSWLVRVGDRIDIGDALVEVENEIATMEITSLHKGIIGGFYASEGMIVPVGDSLAVILDEGEDLPEPPSNSNGYRSNDSSTKVRVNNGLETGTAKFNSTEGEVAENNYDERISSSGMPRVFISFVIFIVIGIVAFLSYDHYLTKEEEKEKKDNQRKKEIEQEYDLRAIEFSKPEVRNEMLGNLKIGDKIILQMKSLELFSGSSIISIDSNIIELKGGLFRNNEVQKVSIENIRWLKLRVRNKE